MEHIKKLVGQHIYLSPHLEEDAETFFHWRNDLSLTQLLGHPTRVSSLEAERANLRERSAGPDHHFSILTLDGDKLIGYCGIRDFNWLHQSARVGIFIGDTSCRGKGYGTEAMELLVGFGFDFLNMHSIALSVLDYNGPAIKSYQKVGFRECGRCHEALRIHGQWHDWVEMEILEPWWRAQNAASS